MIPDLILFIGTALVAVASALGMLFSKNPVYSALNLIVNFAAVALLYLTLNAPFIALSQITVYTGAIMVLFLFVIMMLGAGRPQSQQTALVWQRPLAFGLGIILILEAAYVVFNRSGILPRPETVPADFGGPVSIGEMLFSQYLLPFEITSILLLIAMIGVIVLTKRKV